jgi:hypothetical protein
MSMMREVIKDQRKAIYEYRKYNRMLEKADKLNIKAKALKERRTTPKKSK